MGAECRPYGVVGSQLHKELVLHIICPLGVSDTFGSGFVEQTQCLSEDLVLDFVTDIQPSVDFLKALGQCLWIKEDFMLCGVLKASAALACMAVVQVIYQNG